MKNYIDMVNEVIANGTWKQNRTGIRTIYYPGALFRHDMSKGFPILTSRKLGIKNNAIELEGFIHGITDKSWYQERGCYFWDDWCNPQKVPYSNNVVVKSAIKSENDLGPIYGSQWRDWQVVKDLENMYTYDQFDFLIKTLKKNPLDRRMIVLAWNPADLHKMALPPCHFAFQCMSDGEYLDLIWYQRSCDMIIGVPADILLYGMLLELIAIEVHLKPRYLLGSLADCHIYENHITGWNLQMNNRPKILPTLKINTKKKSIYEWTHKDLELRGYEAHPGIKYDIAV